MNNASEPLKIKGVPDVNDLLKLWDLREDILHHLQYWLADCETYQGTQDLQCEIQRVIKQVNEL